MEISGKSKLRERRRKGELSVLDEFNDNAPPIIVGTLKIDADTAKHLEERAKVVDAPVEVRLQKVGVRPPSSSVELPTDPSADSYLKANAHLIGDTFNTLLAKDALNGFSAVVDDLVPFPLAPSEITANGKRTDSERIANNKQTDSDWISISKQSVSNQIANGKQLVSERIANNKQSDSDQIAVTDRTANGKQTDSKQIANEEQIDSDRKAIREQTGSSTIAEQEAISKQTRSERIVKQEVNGKQTDSANSFYRGFWHLSSLQRIIVFFVYQELKTKRLEATRAIKTQELSLFAQTTKNTIKDAISKLKKKGVLTVADSVDGADGWVSYQLTAPCYSELCELEKTENLKSLILKTDSEREAKREATASSSSSSLILEENLKLTTTEQPPSLDLSPEWKEIDFSELIELGLHFGRPQLQQWFDRKYCDARQAQESIWHFAFHMRHAKRESFRTGPLNFFMGIMAKSKYFPRPDGYLSPEEEALHQRIESERKASERKQAMQHELFDLVFEKWFDTLTQNEINTHTLQYKGFDVKKSILRDKFRNEFYLTIRDNPSVDVRTLKLETSAPNQFAEDPKPLVSAQPAKDPLDPFRNAVAQLTEEVRQIEVAIRQEPRESMRAELMKGLQFAQKKRQQILDSNPIIAEECRFIETVCAGLPG